MQPMLYRDRILLATTADTLYTFSRAGAPLEKLALPATASATPLLAGDTLIAPLHDSRVYVILLDSLRIARRYTVDAPVLAPPVRQGDAWYVLSRAGSVWKLSDVPTRIATTGSAVRASFAGADGRLVAGTLDGRVIAMATNGTVLWEIDVGEAVGAPATIAAGTIYVPLLRGDVVALRAEGRSSR
jgi:outer membrane protein assembly factor BamB